MGNQINITTQDGNSVVVNTTDTNVISVITAGPQGAQGPQGQRGDSGNIDTGSFVTNSQTSSFVTTSQTSSFVTNSQTSSFVTTSQTSSFVTNSQTSSFVKNSQTASFATTGSNTFTGNQTISGSLNVSGSTNIRPYKVYTALLTQTGGNDPQTINTGTLTIGTTYTINIEQIDSNGFDFTNVGAPNNNRLTTFVATGTTPNSWGANEGDPIIHILTYNGGTPVATVLENTIGNIYWTYDEVGVYVANLTGGFPENKTFVTLTWGSGNFCVINSQRGTNDWVFINVNDLDSPHNAIDVNGLMQIEIRVYN